MSIVDVLEFFEKRHRTALSKYRGTPWTILKQEPEHFPPVYKPLATKTEGYEIVDRVSGRHLATAYSTSDSIAPRFNVYTVHLEASVVEEVEKQNGRFASIDECAQFVWKNSMTVWHRGTWYVIAMLVFFADKLSALAKLVLKATLAVFLLYAVYRLTIYGELPLLLQEIAGVPSK